MTKLHISDSLALPVETVTSTLVVYGGKGMGKTNFGAVLVEEMSGAGLRWCVADPMGVWWGLRHSKDGKGKGVECLILGGPHGDIPIEPTGGKIVADLVVDENVNVIIDFSRKTNGETWGVGEKIRFMTDYGSQIFQRQGGLVEGRRREPLFQVLDEAARFIPQMVRAGQPQLSMCLSVWAQMVEEGRNHGLGVCLLTQRSARLNKDVAELADVMIAFRTVGPNSVAAVTDWLGENIEKEHIKSITQNLRSLPVGRCLIVSPGWLQVEDIVQVRSRQTFDSSATPKPGERSRRATGVGAKPDLEKYAARMKEVIERAKENDPAQLKARIAELEKKWSQASAGIPQQDVQKAVQTAVSKALLQRDQMWMRSVEDYGRRTQTLLEAQLKEVANVLQEVNFVAPSPIAGVDVGVDVEVEVKDSRAATAKGFGAHKARAVQDRSSKSADQMGVDAGARRMLVACVQWSPHGVTEAQVAKLAKLSRKGGTFSTYKSQLKVKGLVEIRGNTWYATPAAIAYLGDDVPEAPTTTSEVLKLWSDKIDRGALRMLHVLVGHAGRPVSREQLAQESDLTHGGGTFTTYLSQLNTAQLITMPDKQTVAANKETLFL